MRQGMRRALLTLASCTLGGCEGQPSCEEDIRAQVLDARVNVAVGELTVTAELADEASERERGWKHRRCDLEALLLVPDAPSSELPIWGCGLSTALDVMFIEGGLVTAIERLEPCPEPCGSCESIGEQLLVDAVLEVPADALGSDVQVGATVNYTLP